MLKLALTTLVCKGSGAETLDVTIQEETATFFHRNEFFGRIYLQGWPKKAF